MASRPIKKAINHFVDAAHVLWTDPGTRRVCRRVAAVHIVPLSVAYSEWNPSEYNATVIAVYAAALLLVGVHGPGEPPAGVLHGPHGLLTA